MATASSKAGVGAGDGNDPADAKRKKIMEKVKKEVRSILLTAQQTGRSPEDLDRDYRDLNGRPIPYKDLGYENIYMLLDAMPDVVDAYQMNGTSDIVLFAKSSKATEHLEYLISKAKPNKLGRFGGVIQQPPECRRGTPERRKLIEKRLIEVASQFYPSFVSYLELCNAYERRYFEPLDSKGDFNCPPKYLFNLKLEHAFEVQSGSAAGGHFSVRVRQPAQAAVANKENAPTSSSNILGVGGFGQHQKSRESMQEQEAAKAAAEAAASIVSAARAMDQAQAHALESQRENMPVAGVPLFAMHPQHMIRPVQPMFGLPMPLPVQAHLGQRTPLPPHLVPPFTMPPHNFIGPPAHQVVFTPSAPQLVPGPAFVMNQAATVGGNQFMNAYHHVPMPVQQNPYSVPVTELLNQPRPVQPDSGDSGFGRASSSGTLDATAAPFEPKKSGSDASVHSSAMVTANESIGAASSASTIVKRRGPSPLVVSHVVPEMIESEVKHRQPSGGAQISNEVEDKVNATMESLRASSSRAENASRISALKEECRKVLHRYPNGLSYLHFGKAYREVNGKDLDLAPLDVLSVMELAEMLTDVFRISSQGREVLLFPTQPDGASSMTEMSGANASVQDQAGQPVDEWVESVSEHMLIAELWRIAMASPGRSLLKNQIPSEYQKATGKRFPIPDSQLDSWALKFFDYGDRFEFAYEGELKIIALPHTDDLNIENTDAEIRNASIPKDFAQHGETIPTQQFPVTTDLRLLEASDPGRFFKVILAQVYTPGQFYVQLESTYETLENLSKALNEYVSKSTLSNKAKMHSPNIKEGLLCAVRWDCDNMWYRGLIKEVSQDGFHTIFLLDYGTEISANLEDLRYLPREFLELPAQAIEARLAALSPVGQAWTTDAGDRLSEICGTSFLWAELFKFSADGIPEIFLVLVNDDEEELHINDDLISKGFALFNETEAIEAGLNHMDLEHEIDSPEGSPNQPVMEEAEGEEEEEETPERIMNTELDQQVVSELRQAVAEGNMPLEEVLYMAKTYLSRRRLAIWKLLSQPAMGQDLINLAVDKVKWLENQIQWLEQLLV